MKQFLLPEGGTFYKANLHMHTVVSDGEMTPEEVKAAYLAQGYSIVAFTDHEVIVPHTDLTDGQFLALTGFEAAINLPRPPHWNFEFMTACHLNFYAKRADNVLCPAFSEEGVWLKHSRAFVTDEMRAHGTVRRYATEDFNRLIAAANEAGFLVSFNHPVWSGQNFADYGGMKGLWGVECYNTASTLCGYPDTVQPYDDLLRAGERLVPLATDDAHTKRDCFLGYVMIKSDTLTYDDVIRAMERGALYASTGPAIEALTCEDGWVHIVTSPAAEIVLTTERRFACRAAAESEPLTGARFDLRRYLAASKEGPDASSNCYFRITVKDGTGRCAWTRAYFADEIE